MLYLLVGAVVLVSGAFSARWWIQARVARETAMILVYLARRQGAWVPGTELIYANAARKETVFVQLVALEAAGVVESVVMPEIPDVLRDGIPLRLYRLQGFPDKTDPPIVVFDSVTPN